MVSKNNNVFGQGSSYILQLRQDPHKQWQAMQFCLSTEGIEEIVFN